MFYGNWNWLNLKLYDGNCCVVEIDEEGLLFWVNLKGKGLKIAGGWWATDVYVDVDVEGWR